MATVIYQFSSYWHCFSRSLIICLPRSTTLACCHVPIATRSYKLRKNTTFKLICNEGYRAQLTELTKWFLCFPFEETAITFQPFRLPAQFLFEIFPILLPTATHVEFIVYHVSRIVPFVMCVCRILIIIARGVSDDDQSTIIRGNERSIDLFSQQLCRPIELSLFLQFSALVFDSLFICIDRLCARCVPTLGFVQEWSGPFSRLQYSEFLHRFHRSLDGFHLGIVLVLPLWSGDEWRNDTWRY